MCKKMAAKEMKVGPLDYANSKGIKAFKAACKPVSFVPSCRKSCQTNLELFAEPSKDTCDQIPSAWVKDCKKRIPAKSENSSVSKVSSKVSSKGVSMGLGFATVLSLIVNFVI